MVSVAGNAIMIISFVFIGPLPFVPIEPTLPLLRGIMALSAFGYGLVMVSTFSRAQLATVRHGYEKDIETYLLISGQSELSTRLRFFAIIPTFIVRFSLSFLITTGMWSSSFYFGNFLGPTLAGVLVESSGFRQATILYWALYLVFGVIDVCELTYNVKNKISAKSSEYETM